MNKNKKNFNIFFKKEDLTQNELYSSTIVKSLTRSLLEPLTGGSSKGIVFYHLPKIENTQGIIKRLEYSNEITLREFSDFEFSKFDVEQIGFIVLTSQRYNAAFLFKEVEKDKFEIYLKLNSKLVNNVYETLKSTF